MDVIILANSLRLLWPELLIVVLGVLYLIGARTLKDNALTTPSRIRVLSSVGFPSTASVVLLGINPSYYTIAAIPVIPAPFVFGSLMFQPNLIMRSRKLRNYLTACAAVSVLVWLTQFAWLLTR